jgi:hypothetical protein
LALSHERAEKLSDLDQRQRFSAGAHFVYITYLAVQRRKVKKVKKGTLPFSFFSFVQAALNHPITLRHASESWHPAFLPAVKLGPSFRWGDGQQGVVSGDRCDCACSSAYRQKQREEKICGIRSRYGEKHFHAANIARPIPYVKHKILFLKFLFHCSQPTEIPAPKSKRKG